MKYLKSTKVLTIAAATTTALLVAACGQVTSSSSQPVDSRSPSPTASSSIAAPPVVSDLVAAPPKKVKPPKRVSGGPPMVTKIDIKKKIVFLTIDDGYHTDPSVAKTLADTGIPATQFLTDNAVNGTRYSYFQQISKLDGQTIQNHTLSHPDLKALSFAQQKEQICGTNQKFKKAFGETPWILRPPYGSFNESVRKAAGACGIEYIANWSTTMPRDKIRYQVGKKLRPGDIILTHWSEQYRDWLPGLIKEVKKQGFKFGALQDYLPKK